MLSKKKIDKEITLIVDSSSTFSVLLSRYYIEIDIMSTTLLPEINANKNLHIPSLSIFFKTPVFSPKSSLLMFHFKQIKH